MQGIAYQKKLPFQPLEDFVKCFWFLSNDSAEEKSVTVLPDGYFDILCYSANQAPFTISMLGLSTKPAKYVIPENASCFAISFRLAAAEYILHEKIGPLADKARRLPPNFWGFAPADLASFKNFVEKATKSIELAEARIEPRKKQLFDLLYRSNGAVSVVEIADTVHWTSRQINRYFKTWFGTSLKAYCNILRYRASFEHLKEGRLYPTENYADQAHFIKEVKKFSDVTPKQLAENKNDRFIQFSTLLEG